MERQRLRELLDGIKERRQEIFAQAEEKARKTAQKFEEELKEWIRRQKEERKALQGVLRLSGHRKEIQEIKERSFPTLRKKGPSATPAGLEGGRSGEN